MFAPAGGRCHTKRWRIDDPPYDLDGNLTSKGGLTLVYNGENRLIEAFPASPVNGDQKCPLNEPRLRAGSWVGDAGGHEQANGIGGGRAVA